MVSIHAPREGCDGVAPSVQRRTGSFNSRTPGGVRPPTAEPTTTTAQVSIHAPREGCDRTARQGRRGYAVSIHAPREGCDACLGLARLSMKRFNSRTPGGVRQARAQVLMTTFLPVSIHAPREGCDNALTAESVNLVEFQFTHPGRGATRRCLYYSIRRGCFNSRTPGGVRPQQGKDINYEAKVSIHAPREGCDSPAVVRAHTPIMFQFTHPGRGATQSFPRFFGLFEKFQFTHPGRGATESRKQLFIDAQMFQFTHPGRGATPAPWRISASSTGFNSRTPGGVRHHP